MDNILEHTMGDQKATPQILQNNYKCVARFLHDFITKKILKKLMHLGRTAILTTLYL